MLVLALATPLRLLRRMARDDVLVEQCLTSNPVYRRFGVPIALCTDDEGVARTDRALKRISRDSLEYGFLQPAARREALRGLDADFETLERRYR